MKFELNGLDDLQKNLNQLSKNAKELDGEHSVPFDELFNEKFMIENTNFSDIESIDDNELDNFVSSNTDFESWEDMKSAAGSEWVTKRLGF
ncbi:hypothetical protein [Enterococcus hirae]|uniref:hypothetical protein n=1 Tax=Enterococcus hirae TaxID=1354 RepID=UPI003CE53C20